jgi:hypothetical protein
VLLSLWVVRLQQVGIHLDLMSKSHAPFVIDQPNCTTGGGQGRNDSLKDGGVVFGSRSFGLGKVRNLVDQAPNVPFCTFDILVRWSGCHSFRSIRKEDQINVTW